MKKTIMSVIATVLIVLALATLFLDGVGFSREVMSDINGMMDQSGVQPGQSGQTLSIDDLSRSLGISVSDLAGAGDIQYSLDTMNQLAGMLASGGLSMIETRSLLSTFVSMARSSGETEGVSGGSADVLGFMNIISICYTAFVVLIFLLGALALSGVWLRRKALAIPFAVFMLLILAANTIIVFAVNGSSGMAGGALFVTPWVILGFVFSLTSAVVCFMPDDDGNPIIQPTASFVTQPDGFAPRPEYSMGEAQSAASTYNSSTGGWICPQCGRPVDAGDGFCGVCGASRPAAESMNSQPQRRQCPNCGSELSDDAVFCPRCGFRLTGGEQPYAQPAHDAYQPPQPVIPTPVANDAYQPQQAYSQPVMNDTYQPQQAYSQPVMNDTYQPQQAYSQPVMNDAYQPPQPVIPTPVANEPWIQESQPQPSLGGSGTVRMLMTEMQPVVMTFVIDQGFSGVHEERMLNLLSSLVVGRMPSSDLQVDDKTVSAAHLQIEREGGNLFVTDLHSTNGTNLNGSPLSGRAPLNSGDRLEIGRTVLTVRF